MSRIIVALPEALATMPAKAFFAQTQGISHTIWKRIKHSGTFRVNGELVNAARTELKNGDLVTYDIVRPSNIRAEKLPLDIRYEDDWLLVVNKPAGQLVHPTTQETGGTLGNAILHHYEQQEERHAYHPVHRLDRETSGLVLIAKQPQIQFKLSPKGSKAFCREYLALIPGQLTPPAGVVDAPIARALPSIILRRVSPEGKPARTHYETIKANDRLSFIRLRLETGRTHQIRVHMAHCGHPLLGDELYGGRRDIIGRQALHAFRLSFIHPMTGEKLVITAPLPEDMNRIVSAL